jgi:hypothetical protein
MRQSFNSPSLNIHEAVIQQSVSEYSWGSHSTVCLRIFMRQSFNSLSLNIHEAVIQQSVSEYSWGSHTTVCLWIFMRQSFNSPSLNIHEAVIQQSVSKYSWGSHSGSTTRSEFTLWNWSHLADTLIHSNVQKPVWLGALLKCTLADFHFSRLGDLNQRPILCVCVLFNSGGQVVGLEKSLVWTAAERCVCV